MVSHTALWCLLGLGLTGLAGAVDVNKFRTCEQGSFCRRYRKYVSRIEGSQGSEFAHAFEPSSIKSHGNTVTAKLLQTNDASVRPLLLDIRFFQDAVSGHAGIVRIQINEEASLHRRFQLQEGDVVMKESDLKPDPVNVLPEGAVTIIKSTAPGDCQVTIRHKPFEIEFAAGHHVLQKVNSRHLLNFERYRQKEAPAHAGLVDATDVDNSDLWEERFGGHTDSKPRGPAAVGLDVSFQASPDVVGLAEHATGLKLGANGFSEPYRMYNLDVFEYALDVPMALYGAVPMVTALHRWPGAAASTSGFLFVNPSEGFVKVDRPSQEGEPTQTWWLFESGVVDLYLFAGPTPEAVLHQYHTVTGWPRFPPLSTLGKHQCRWNYVDVADAVNVNKKFDQHDIPYDVLWLDIEHTDGKKYFTWHPTHFAQPDVLLNSLEATKRHLVTIVDPHIKSDPGYDVFNKMKNWDYFTKTKDGRQYDGWCWPGTSFYPDFCNPEVRDQWANFFSLDYYPHNRKDLYTWNDMNEPSVFNGPEVTMPRDNLHRCHLSSYEVEHRDVHNAYGMYHHMATVQGHLVRAPNVRPFVLTRSFFAGSHRHGAVWTGDNMARWEHLARSVPMLLSLAMCGISFVGADVPGFFYDPEVQLFRRWHQLGIWYPFYRGHAHLETKRREPWLMGDDVTSNIRDQVSVRYQLLPMWYTLFAEWAFGGVPVIRPLWFHNLDDKEAFDRTDDEFLVGSGILVRSISDGNARQGDAYFPAGSWFSFWDLKAAPLPSGHRTVKFHPDHVPVFVKSGQILPKRMRRRRSAASMAADPYTIFIYGDQAKGTLYIDDGFTHDFMQGSYIYDELEFDGTTLQERPGPTLPALGPSKGLPDSERSHRRIERVVFVGLSKKPLSARVAEGTRTADVQLTVEPAEKGLFVATVKRPDCHAGSRWSLQLGY